MRLWLVDGAIHIKTVNPYNDPVELASHEARELVQALEELIKIEERD